MKKILSRFPVFTFKYLWTASFALFLLAPATEAALTHEYSFNDVTTTTNAIDSVSGANGVLYPGASYPGDGTVLLDGSAGYVDLPDDIISNYSSITFEIWTKPTSNPIWARLFDIGTDNGNGGGQTWTYLCLSDGNGQFRGDILSPNDGEGIIAGPTPAAGVKHHLIFTEDAVAQTAALYDDGVLVAYKTNFTVTPQMVGHTFNGYIGRSEFSADARYNGSIDEFRIYDNAVTPAQAEADYEAGPDSTSGSAGDFSAIQFDNPANVIIGGEFQPTIVADYTSLTNKVNITLLPGITYSSDDTNVIAFGTDGRFHAVASGSTTLHAAYQSKTATLFVTVSSESIVLAHRYSFNGAAGDTVITDSVAGADGTLINGDDSAALTGTGQLNLDGNQSSAYVSLPSGMMATLTNATFEVWANNQDTFSDWAELFAFGANDGTAGQTYITLVPNNPVTHSLRFEYKGAADELLDAPTPLAFDSQSCITVTYSYSKLTASIYVNGRKVATRAITQPLYTIPDSDNYIGQSEWYGSGDPYFDGILDEFRIYSGAKSDLQIAVDAAAGPDNSITDPGALLSLTVAVATTNVDAHGTGVPIQVLANFENISGVDISTLPETTITSGNTSVGTIENGNFLPNKLGTSIVTASYGNMSGSLAFNVVDTNAWPTLLHRWTFNDAPGSTTLTDSVGSIDGTVNGPATFDGSQLIMPSGNPAPSGGQPTAGSGWVSFPANQGLVTGLPNEASFEIWVTWNGGGVWQEMFDFGQAASPGVSSGGGQYVMICPQDGANNKLHVEWDQNPDYDVTLLGPDPLPIGVLSQIVWTHDQDRQLDKLYLNGKLVATAANTALWSTLPDTDNWLARDEWPDPMFNGSYSDFRIWNGALTPGQVANLYAAGPNLIAAPPLQISVAGSQITLQWPANATGFTLQSTTNLAGGTWTTVSGTPTVANSLNMLTLPVSTTQTFYRLIPNP